MEINILVGGITRCRVPVIFPKRLEVAKEIKQPDWCRG